MGWTWTLLLSCLSSWCLPGSGSCSVWLIAPVGTTEHPFVFSPSISYFYLVMTSAPHSSSVSSSGHLPLFIFSPPVGQEWLHGIEQEESSISLPHRQRLDCWDSQHTCFEELSSSLHLPLERHEGHCQLVSALDRVVSSLLSPWPSWPVAMSMLLEQLARGCWEPQWTIKPFIQVSKIHVLDVVTDLIHQLKWLRNNWKVGRFGRQTGMSHWNWRQDNWN